MTQIKTLLIVTGASEGYGRALAESFSAIFPGDTTNVAIIARNEDGLKITAASLQAKANIIPFDLTNVDQIPELIQSIFAPLGSLSSLQTIYLFNNAGAVRPTKFMVNATAAEVEGSLRLNVLSPVVLCNEFFKHLHAVHADLPALHTIRIVNISSLCAQVAFPSSGTYCIGRAARDMHMKVLATELKDREIPVYQTLPKDIKVLNWAPGPMHETTIGQQTTKESESEILKAAMLQGGSISVSFSIEKLVGLMKEDSYETASHIDIFDV